MPNQTRKDSVNNSVVVCCVVALTCEAQALIESYQLKKISSKPFHYFKRDQINLIISGVGKAKSAAAVGWLGSQMQGNNCVWLNIGTAGHQSLDVGTIVRIHAIKNELNKTFYPPLLPSWKGASSKIVSIDQPSDDYPQDSLVDMESSAFFVAARLFAQDERIQCLKVVSDNADSDYRELTPKKITVLMQAHCELLMQYAYSLASLFNHEQPRDVAVPAHLHCTQSQQHQFDGLVRRLMAVRLFDEKKINLDQYKNMRELIQALQSILQSHIPACEDIDAQSSVGGA